MILFDAMTSNSSPKAPCFASHIPVSTTATSSHPAPTHLPKCPLSSPLPYRYAKSRSSTIFSSFRMSATTATTTTIPPKAPHSVRTANVVIVGAGPCGALAAAFLHQRGVPVTLIEQVPDFSKLNVNRSYIQVVFLRGRQALEAIPGLLEHLVPDSVLITVAKASLWSPDGTMKTVARGRPPVDGNPNLHLLRSDLSSSLQRFVVDNCDSVTTMYGTSADAISFEKDGEMELSLTTNGRKHSLRTRLVLACDGRNSTVAKELLRAEKEGLRAHHISSSKGCGLSTLMSPSVGMNIKAVLVKQNFSKYLNPAAPPEDTAEGNTHVLLGKGKKRPRNATFNIVVFPLLPKTAQSIGGLLGLIAGRPEHDVWQLKNTEEAYKLFEENLPQANVRECISAENMKEFVDSRPSVFCPITRRDSLAFHVGAKHSGGVLLMGDSLHSFPPDIGQGVNSAFEDVAVFGKVLDDCEDETPLSQILGTYEKLRDEDTSALTRIARDAALYQYGQSIAGVICQQLNTKFRRKLATLFPGFLHPAMIQMVVEDLTYSDIARRADSTTRRLYMVLVSLMLVLVVGFLFGFGLIR